MMNGNMEQIYGLINRMVAISFDISVTRTGWTALKGMNVILYGAIEIPEKYKKLTHKQPEFGELLHWYTQEIESIVRKVYTITKRIDIAVVEDLNVRFVPMGKAIMQVHGAVKIGIIMGCALTKIIAVNNKTVKSLFEIIDRKKLIPEEIVAKAKAEKVKPVKVQMVDVINRMYPHMNLSYQENDEADAVALAITALKMIGESADG
jgi:Holliday junction resolvasome RuvABC endonuclease subunit